MPRRLHSIPIRCARLSHDRVERRFYFEDNINVGLRGTCKEGFDLLLVIVRVLMNAVIEIENHIHVAPTGQVFIERQKLSCRCANG
jgi:hypothetical protein